MLSMGGLVRLFVNRMVFADRCIPAYGVARRLNTQGIHASRAGCAIGASTIPVRHRIDEQTRSGDSTILHQIAHKLKNIR